MKLHKKAIIAWSFFDWANSAFPTIVSTFIFATYFTQSVAIDPITGTSQWGYAQTIAGLCIAFLSPVCGSIADFAGRRKQWLGFFSLLCILGTASLGFIKPEPTYVFFLLTAVVISTIGFEVGMAFYNALLLDIAPKNYIGRISGWAWGLGYAGGLAALLLCFILFLQHDLPVRYCGPFAAVWFALFSLPLFIVVKEIPGQRLPIIPAIRQGFSQLIDTFEHVKQHRNILRYLIAHMFYTDAVNTLFVFGAIYAAETFGFSMNDIFLLGIVLNLSAGLGAFAFAFLDDAWGAKKTLLLSLFCLAIVIIALLLIQSKLLFWIMATLLSLFFGPIQSASRSLMARLTPLEHRNEYFGLYALSGKITAFLSPWLVAWLTFHTQNQRLGFASILIFLVIGVYLTMSVNEHEKDIC